MKLLILALAVAVLACSSALDRLASRAETIPPHWWGYDPPSGDALVDTMRRLTLAARYLGVTIVREDLGPGVWGQYTPATRTVLVNSALRHDAQVQVVAHELAHALQPPGLTELPDREVFADAVAYLVVLRERDDLDAFAGYLGRYGAQARQVIHAHRTHIEWAATVLSMEAR